MMHTVTVQNNLVVAHLRANNILHATLLCASNLQQHQRMMERVRVEKSLSPHSGTGVRNINISIDQCMLLSNPDGHHGAIETADAFIYKAGISIPTAEIDPTIITPILIFNTALAHQLLAEQDCGNSLKHLNRAKALYEVAYKSLEAPDTNLLLEFAILNNVAMIYRELGDENTAKEYFDYLLSTWMMFVDRECSVQLCQLRGFLQNLPKYSIAAVAA